MATPAMQRYVAEIFRLQQDTAYVALNELSESANSSMQATARMVDREGSTDCHAGFTMSPFGGSHKTG